MHIGEVRQEIQDPEGNTLGFLVNPGLDGMVGKELRYWRQLWLRRRSEAEQQ